MSLIVRRTARALAAVALAVTGTAVAHGAPAQAAASCPDESGYLCFWQHVNRGGAMGKVQDRNAWWGEFVGGCGAQRWNDCASSVQNEGLRCEAVLWADINYGGAGLTIHRDSFVNLTDYGFNDRVSSNSWKC